MLLYSSSLVNGESQIEKLVCIDSSYEICTPCGACRELIMQLDKESKNIQVLLNTKTYEYTTMEKMMPNWWGYSRFE